MSIKKNKVYKNSIEKYQNYFLSGHSMGGANAIYIALQEQKKNTLNIKGIILIAPMCQIVHIPPPFISWLLENIVMTIIPNAKVINFNATNRIISMDPMKNDIVSI